MQQRTQLTGWRLGVRNWLAAVLSHQHQSLHADFYQAAQELHSTFPPSFWIGIAVQFIKPLGVWIVKSALKDAAADLNITLSDEALNFLSELAIEALAAT
jgi:hypothetical protein